MKIFKVEERIVDWIKRNINTLFVIVITLIGLYIRFKLKDYISGDYRNWLLKWVTYIQNNGGFFALKETFSNYNQPYIILLALISYIKINPLYLIKSLSVVFDLILSIFSAKIVGELTKEDNRNKMYMILTYCIIFMLPTVMMNSSLWAQCDSIYTTFAIISLYNLIKGKYTISFIFLGVSFAFKLQFIFIIPLYIILYFKHKNFSIFNFLLLPIINIILCLPAIMVGHPLKHCFSIYFNQIVQYKYLTVSMFNFWSFFPNKYEYLSYIGYTLVMVFFGIILFLILKNDRKKLKPKDYISLALLSIMVCVFFLPSMHERYLYMADILSVIWFFAHKDRIIIPIGIQLVSFISYLPYLFGNNQYFCFAGVLFAYVIYTMIKYINKEKIVRL